MRKFIDYIKDFFWCKELAIFKIICIILLGLCLYTLYWIFATQLNFL